MVRRCDGIIHGNGLAFVATRHVVTSAKTIVDKNPPVVGSYIYTITLYADIILILIYIVTICSNGACTTAI